jgi:ribonuclease P protein component
MQQPCASRGLRTSAAFSSGFPKQAFARAERPTLAGLERLRRRADFLRAAKGKRFHARGFTLQVTHQPGPLAAVKGCTLQNTLAAPAGPVQPDSGRAAQLWAEAKPRFGFIVTKRSGGAVERNRIRRRLKEALRLIKPLPARPGCDYVICARPEALGMTFEALQAELLRAFKKAGTPDFSPPVRHDQDHRAAKAPDKARRTSSHGRTPKG